MSEPGSIAATLNALRTCFHNLKAYGDTVHADLGLNASMRGAVEALADEGPRTVPQIAKLKGVSRQYIQAVVDELESLGFVAIKDNPGHRRSPLVALTRAGELLLKTIRQRETKILSRLAPGFSEADLATTRRTLETFDRWLRVHTDRTSKA